jgi:hypothetical protein
MKFPRLIYVTIDSNSESEFLLVQEGGVFSVDTPGEKIAIYKLMSKGIVRIEKSYQEQKKA